MARRKGKKRQGVPGAGQDAGRRRQRDPEVTEEHSIRGRTTGGQLHKQGEKRSKAAPSPKPRTATPKPRPSAPKPGTSNEVIAFSAMAAHRGAPAPSAQRDRLIAMGIIKEVANV